MKISLLILLYSILLVSTMFQHSTSQILQEKIEVMKQLGDRRIKIIAPSHAMPKEDLENLKKHFSFLNWSFPEMIEDDPLGLSNTDEYRKKSLIEALSSDDDDILWCLRGGGGAARIIPDLYNISKPTKEKIVIGFSDITNLHLFLTKEWNWKPFWGPVLSQLVYDNISPDNYKKMVNVLNGEQKFSILDDLKPLNKFAQNTKTISAIWTGGTLHHVVASLATLWQIETEDRIVFLESVHFKAFLIEINLTHLINAGVFDKAKAFVIGKITNETDEGPIKDFGEKMKVPVFKSELFGHQEFNAPMRIGCQATIQCDETQKFVMRVEL